MATPCCIIIAAVTIFIVEPGACAPSRAALKPSAGLFATARIAPVDGSTAVTEARPYALTAFSAAAWTFASMVVLIVPGFPCRSTRRGVSATASLPESIQVSTPVVPPACAPYRCRRVSMITPSEGYFSLVSSPPFRSTALTEATFAVPVRRVASAVSFGWRTVGFHCTRGRPVVCPRTTVSSEAYDRSLDAPSYETVALTVNGTFVPTGAPGVITAFETFAPSL